MLKHLGVVAKQTLFSIFNQSWKAGTVPNIWKMAHIISILKKGKNKLLYNSYRPISLLSCVDKLLERIVNKRLLSLTSGTSSRTSSTQAVKRIQGTIDNVDQWTKDWGH
jgi:hypothetical protein